MSKLKLAWHWVILATLLGCVVSAQAADATQPLGLGTPVMDAFTEITKSFEAALKPAGLRLFGLLMLIEASVWSFKTLMQDETSVGSWAFGLTQKVMIWGFFAWLLNDSHGIMTAIIRSFFVLGGTATGLGATLNPSDLLYTGIETAVAISSDADLTALSFLEKPLIVLTAILAELCIMAAFVVAAAQLVMAQVEAMVVIAAAPVLLSFGALSFTRDIAVNVLRHALSTGVKVLTIYMIAGLMTKLGPVFTQVLRDNSDQIMSSPGQLLEVIGVALLLLLLSFFIPTIANSMLSGSTGLSGTAALGAAVGAAAAAATGGAAAASVAGTVGNAGAAGAMEATGLAKALGAGMDSAHDMGLSGPGAVGHAVGEVASHGLGLSTQGMSNMADNVSSAFAASVEGTTGGKIANAIQASRGGAMEGLPADYRTSTPPSASPVGGGSSGSGAQQNGNAVPQNVPGTSASESGDAAVASAGEAAGASYDPQSQQSGDVAAAGGVPGGAPPAAMGDATGASIGGAEVATGANASSSAAPNKGMAGRTADRLTSLSGLIQTGQDHLKSMDDRTVVTAAPINIQASA